MTKTINATLLETIERAPKTVSFRFEPTERVNFQPGQFMQVQCDPDNPGNKELNKYLSFSSSPTREYVEVTKRLSDSAFSNALCALRPGDELRLKLPLGNCVFEESQAKIGFLIGGIGITPVISIVEYIAEKNLTTDVVVLYSNRTYDTIAFRDELKAWSDAHQNIKGYHTVTDCPAEDTTCSFGFITKELVCEKAPDVSERTWFIFGPPPMVETMRHLCTDSGCLVARIKAENFIGY